MRPDYKVIADDVDVTAAIRPNLVSLTVVDEAGLQTDTCEIVLNDTGGTIELPKRGVALQVSLGYAGALVPKGTFIVDEVEPASPPQTLTIRAKAADNAGTVDTACPLKDRHTRSWANKPLKDIFGDIAAGAKLTLRIHPSLAGKVRDHWDQTGDSDSASAMRLAHAEGGEMKIAGGCMIIYPQGSGMTSSGAPMPSISLVPENGTSWKVTYADREKYSSVAASYHDPQLAKTVTVEAGDPDGVTLALRGDYPDPTSALSAAKARLGALQRGAAVLHMEMPGNAALAAECPVTLTGFRRGGGVDGKWIATHVEHTIVGSSGFRTVFDAEVPGVTI